jgi:membrane-bound lytic murein transglycosylase D
MNKIRLIFIGIFFFCALNNSNAQVWNSFKPLFDFKEIDSLAQVEQGAPTNWMIDPSLIQGRLKQLNNIIPLNYNFHTHQFVEYFAFKKSEFTQRMLEKRDVYFPLYEKYLKRYNLPDELKYLSLIESGLDPRALSNKGAGGLWQFMPYTATKDFGLRVDPLIDERFDPERATEAACKYMRQLYRIFGDWHLVLAAYNTGPGNVKRAIRNCKGDDFWSVYNCLPKQTRAYVPQFIAITYMMNYHWDHAIHPENLMNTIASDTLMVSGYKDLITFSNLSGIGFDTLRQLNPQILTKFLPRDSKNYIIRIPQYKADFIKLNRIAILDSSSKEAINGGNIASSNAMMQIIKSRYKVKRGESIYDVARKFDLSVFELKRLNRLRKTKVRRGQLIWVFEKKWIDSEELAKKSFANQQSLASNYINKKSVKKKNKYYKVREGDTLSDIVAKYDGLTLSKIKKLNRLKSIVIKPGMKLRIS